MRITLGTDGNRAWGPHEEMADMVAAGMTPAQVIVAATRNSAEFLRLADTGTLQAGKSADFIVLDANPLDRHHQHAAHLAGGPARRGGGPFAAAAVMDIEPPSTVKSGRLGLREPRLPFPNRRFNSACSNGREYRRSTRGTTEEGRG